MHQPRKDPGVEHQRQHRTHGQGKQVELSGPGHGHVRTGYGDIEAGNTRNQPGRYRIQRVLLARQQARNHQAGKRHGHHTADNPQRLPEPLAVRRRDGRKQQQGDSHGTEKVTGDWMVELSTYRIRMLEPLAQVAQRQQHEHQTGQCADRFTEQGANTVILATQAPGQAQTGQTHD
ncbi:hypothetical protein D3C78_1022650 [compost metagenome]